jgi:hypothetical protein
VNTMLRSRRAATTPGSSVGGLRGRDQSVNFFFTMKNWSNTTKSFLKKDLEISSLPILHPSTGYDPVSEGVSRSHRTMPRKIVAYASRAQERTLVLRNNADHAP